MPFDLALAAGNVAFALAFGPALIRALTRFRERLDVTWHPAGASLGVALVALALAPAPAHAASAIDSSVAYLRAAQNRDGGFGPRLARPPRSCTPPGRRWAWPPPAARRAERRSRTSAAAPAR